jgi:translation elongation factor EF-4
LLNDQKSWLFTLSRHRKDITIFIENQQELEKNLSHNDGNQMSAIELQALINLDTKSQASDSTNILGSSKQKHEFQPDTQYKNSDDKNVEFKINTYNYKEYDSPKDLRALVFDFQYSNHQGVIVYTRIFDGEVTAGTKLRFKIAGESFITNEIGIFKPSQEKTDKLEAGEIGYIVTGIKRPGVAKVGDTIVLDSNPLSELPGYEEPRPVVWASIFPESQDDFDLLRSSLGRLKLSDASIVFEEESFTILR